MGERALKALRECAEWLVKCLEFGWSRDDLDALEALWWEYHDHTGRLVARKGA